MKGPFDPDPESKSRFGDREATGARMGAGLPSVGKHGMRSNGRLARVGATSGRVKAFSTILEDTLTKGMPTGSLGCREDEVEGPFDPGPEFKSKFVDRKAAGAGIGAGLPSVGKDDVASNGWLARDNHKRTDASVQPHTRKDPHQRHAHKLAGMSQG